MSRRGTNIRKRTDGRWEGRYYIVDTAGSKKCKSVYGHSYKEVTERLLTAKAASLNQTAAPKQSAITVKAVAEKWLESIASSRKCSTIQKYSTIYNKYIKPNWGESVIDELNQNEILKELPETAGESVTKSILCIFNSILAYGAATYGTGEIHLSYRAKRSSVTSSNNINTINTIDQQKLTEYLLTELDIYKLGILLCLFMGLRLGEICALKWEDIDMISRTLHVNRTVQRLPVDTVHTSDSSQNNHTATKKTSLYIDSPKTSNSLREIPIPDFIYDKLSDYYNTSMKGDSYFLKKNQPMDPRTYQNRFHIYIKEAGIGNTHFHALRHTFATNCISSGADASITIRDGVKQFKSLFGSENVLQTIDPAINSANVYGKREKIDGRVGIGIISYKMLIRNNIAITEDEYIDFIKHMIDFLEYHKRKIVVFTNGAIDDYEFACFALRSIGKEKLLEKRPTRPVELVDVIATCEYIISFRLHSLILAAAYDIPSIGLVWDSKVTSFFETIKREEWAIMLNDGLSFEKLKYKIENLLSITNYKTTCALKKSYDNLIEILKE